MAYMSQEKKKALEPKIKEILKKYGVKGRLGVRHHSTLVLNITEGNIDFLGNYSGVTGEGNITHVDVNHYHINNSFSGKAANFLTEIKNAMNINNYDNSDIQTDYFDVGYYIDINIGKWDKPYIFLG